jgi:hypothetical protein
MTKHRNPQKSVLLKKAFSDSDVSDHLKVLMVAVANVYNLLRLEGEFTKDQAKNTMIEVLYIAANDEENQINEYVN